MLCAKCLSFRVALPHRGLDVPTKVCPSCAAPSIARVSTVAAGSNALEIHGHNFALEDAGRGTEGGVDDAAASDEPVVHADLVVTLDEVRCTDVRLGRDGRFQLVRCRAPAGAGRRHRLCVANGALTGTALVDYDPPRIDEVDLAPTGGVRVRPPSPRGFRASIPLPRRA